VELACEAIYSGVDQFFNAEMNPATGQGKAQGVHVLVGHPRHGGARRRRGHGARGHEPGPEHNRGRRHRHVTRVRPIIARARRV